MQGVGCNVKFISHRSDTPRYDDAEALRLVHAIRAGDDGQFSCLYAMTRPRVEAYLCRLLRDQSDVDDILIDTYVEVWRGAKHFRGESLVITWIVGIARNIAMNTLKRRRQCESLDAIPEPIAPAANADEQRSRRRLVEKALAAIPRHHREILVLALLQETSYEQLSRLLAAPVNTIKTRVFYAKGILRAQLETMGVTRDDVI